MPVPTSYTDVQSLPVGGNIVLNTSEPPPAARNYIRLKLLTFGECRAGKSCLIKRFCEKKFIPHYIQTIGVDYGVRQINTKQTRVAPTNVATQSPLSASKSPSPSPSQSPSSSPSFPVKINFFDLSGSAVFSLIRQSFYSDSSAALLVYDCTERSSFDRCSHWLDEAKQFGCAPLIWCVCANKSNEAEMPLAVGASEGRQWAMNIGALFFEVSAKSGMNVDHMFNAIFEATMAKILQNDKTI